MQTKQKIITTILWSVLVLTMLAVVGRGMWAGNLGKRTEPMPEYFDAPSFKLTDQDGKPFGSEDLKGKVWVAAFIFTRCATACPMMSQRFAKMQDTVTSKKVHLVSFTVDPNNDTPEQLKKYADKFKADTSRWHFLTGTEEQMHKAAADLKLSVIPSTSTTQPIGHDEHFLLVDGSGRVRGIYDRKDDDRMKELARDAEALAAETK